MMYDADMAAKFQDLERFTPDDIEAALKRNDPDELLLVSITVALTCEDLPAAQETCLALSRHENNKVRGNAVMSIGHLARRFRILDEDSAKPVIESALNDGDEYVRTRAVSAANELCQFLGWEIEGHVYGV
jgi:HEAT repeat protein